MLQIICTDEHKMSKTGVITTSSNYDEELKKYIFSESKAEFIQCENCSFTDQHSYKTIYSKIVDEDNKELKNYKFKWTPIEVNNGN